MYTFLNYLRIVIVNRQWRKKKTKKIASPFFFNRETYIVELYTCSENTLVV